MMKIHAKKQHGLWTETHKGDSRCRALADRHYSRQRPGHPMFCRPGYNQVFHFSDDVGEAVWVWWRPKWEDPRPGTSRKDGLLAIENTLFRNETGIKSSILIADAVSLLSGWNRIAPHPDGLITGIGVEQTEKRRSRHNLPGHCYRMAGWIEIAHRSGKAGVWLWHPPLAALNPKTGEGE